MNYLINYIGFDFYKPQIKNILYHKEDGSIISIIGNYYYIYSPLNINNTYSLKKGEIKSVYNFGIYIIYIDNYKYNR